MNHLLAAILFLAPACPRETAMEIASVIHTEAKAHAVDPFLVVAVAYVESSLRPWKRNKRTGAAGLMGVHPIHTKEWADPDDVLDIRTNVKVGVGLLARYIQRCGTERGLSKYSGRGCKAPTVYSRLVLKIRAKLVRFEPKLVVGPGVAPASELAARGHVHVHMAKRRVLAQSSEAWEYAAAM